MRGDRFEIHRVIRECSERWCIQCAHFEPILVTAMDPLRLTVFVVTCQNPHAVRTEHGRLLIKPSWHFDERPMDQALYREITDLITKHQLPPVGKQIRLASADDKGVFVRGYINAKRWGLRMWKPSIETAGANGLIAPWMLVKNHG